MIFFFFYLPHDEHYLLLTGRSVREHPFAWFIEPFVNKDGQIDPTELTNLSLSIPTIPEALLNGGGERSEVRYCFSAKVTLVLCARKMAK